MFGGYCFHNLLEKLPKHLHQCLVLHVLCEHKYIVPTLRVGVSLNQGFQSGNRVAFPSQSKLFLRFRSVHSDVVQVYNQPLLVDGSCFDKYEYEDVDGSCFDKYPQIPKTYTQ